MVGITDFVLRRLRSFQAVATTDCIVVEISRAALDVMVAEVPEVATALQVGHVLHVVVYVTTMLHSITNVTVTDTRQMLCVGDLRSLMGHVRTGCVCVWRLLFGASSCPTLCRLQCITPYLPLSAVACGSSTRVLHGSRPRLQQVMQQALLQHSALPSFQTVRFFPAC